MQQLREDNHNLKNRIEKIMVFMNKQQQYIELFCDNPNLKLSRY